MEPVEGAGSHRGRRVVPEKKKKKQKRGAEKVFETVSVKSQGGGSQSLHSKGKTEATNGLMKRGPQRHVNILVATK